MRGICSQPDIHEDLLVCGHPLPCPRHPDWPGCPRCHCNHEHPGDWGTITLGAQCDLSETDVLWGDVYDVESIAVAEYPGRLYLIRVCKNCRADLLMRVNEWWRNPG